MYREFEPSFEFRKIVFVLVSTPEAVIGPTTPKEPVVVAPLTVKTGTDRLPIKKVPDTVRLLTFTDPYALTNPDTFNPPAIAAEELTVRVLFRVVAPVAI
jgi:hypothetical protein